jgi:hypothetical protein
LIAELLEKRRGYDEVFELQDRRAKVDQEILNSVGSKIRRDARQSMKLRKNIEDAEHSRTLINDLSPASEGAQEAVHAEDESDKASSAASSSHSELGENVSLSSSSDTPTTSLVGSTAGTTNNSSTKPLSENKKVAGKLHNM